jgi:ABC-2 type transport system ATP-binding protein
MSRAAVEVRGLTKHYKVGLRGRTVRSLDALDLRVEEGSIYGFVGPNGAGKSTTIRMLVGLAAPTRGEAFIFDRPISRPEARASLGYLPENPSFHDFLRPLEVLEYFGALSGVRQPGLRARAAALLDQVGLGHARDLTVRKFSKGMVQRLGIAQALVHDPPLLILDEPMSGLDPVGRRDVRELILELRRQGKTIFFSTHILSDVETICDRVGMLSRGRLMSEGTITSLLDGTVRAVELRAGGIGAPLAQALGGRAATWTQSGPEHTFTFADVEQANRAAREVLDSGGRLLAFVQHRESLEETFMRVAVHAAAEERTRTEAA